MEKHGKSRFYNKYPYSIASLTPYKDGKTTADSTVGIYYIYENNNKIKTRCRIIYKRIFIIFIWGDYKLW